MGNPSDETYAEEARDKIRVGQLQAYKLGVLHLVCFLNFVKDGLSPNEALAKLEINLPDFCGTFVAQVQNLANNIQGLTGLENVVPSGQ